MRPAPAEKAFESALFHAFFALKGGEPHGVLPLPLDLRLSGWRGDEPLDVAGCNQVGRAGGF